MHPTRLVASPIIHETRNKNDTPETDWLIWFSNICGSCAKSHTDTDSMPRYREASAKAWRSKFTKNDECMVGVCRAFDVVILGVSDAQKCMCKGWCKGLHRNLRSISAIAYRKVFCADYAPKNEKRQRYAAEEQIFKKRGYSKKNFLVQLFYYGMILPQNLRSQTFLLTLSFLHPRPCAQLGSPRIAFTHPVNGH